MSKKNSFSVSKTFEVRQKSSCFKNEIIYSSSTWIQRQWGGINSTFMFALSKHLQNIHWMAFRDKLFQKRVKIELNAANLICSTESSQQNTKRTQEIKWMCKVHENPAGN